MEKVNTSKNTYIKHVLLHILPPTYNIGTSYTDSPFRNKKLMFDEIVFKFFYTFGIRKPK